MTLTLWTDFSVRRRSEKAFDEPRPKPPALNEVLQAAVVLEAVEKAQERTKPSGRRGFLVARSSVFLEFLAESDTIAIGS